MTYSLKRLLGSWFGDRPPAGTPDQCYIAGLAVAGDAAALAIVEQLPGGERRLRNAVAVPANPAAWDEWLPLLIERYSLQRCPINLVLAPADYRLVPTTAPEVPVQELRDALRWRIQETLDFSAEEAEIEYFPLPKPRHAGAASPLMVAVAPAATIQRYESWMADAALHLSAIDIPELALREVVALLPESARGVAFLVLSENRGTIQLQKDDVVFVTRTVDVGMRDLGTLSEDGDTEEHPALKRLALEIQRSMNYFENYYGMSPVAGLVLAPLAAGSRFLAAQLEQTLGVLCRVMDLNALLPCAERLDDATQQACLLAVGAALRQETSQS